MSNRSVAALMEVPRAELDLSKPRLETLSMLVVGMVGARTVNLSHVACERPGSVKPASTYRRLQRLFQQVRLAADWAARLLVRLLRLQGPWLLALDRTQWAIGEKEVGCVPFRGVNSAVGRCG